MLVLTPCTAPPALQNASWRGAIDCDTDPSPEAEAGPLPPLRPAAVPSLLAAQPLLGLLLVAAVPQGGSGAPSVLAIRPATGARGCSVQPGLSWATAQCLDDSLWW